MATSAVGLLLVFAVLGVCEPASATFAIIQPNEWYVDMVTSDWTVDPVYEVSFTWSSTEPLKLSVSGPSGLIRSYDTALSGSGTIRADQGSLYFTWLNTGSTESHLQYEFTSIVTESEHSSTIVFWGFIAAVVIGAVLLVAVILLVVWALGRDRSGTSQAPQPQHVQPGYAPSGACPKCGAPIDSVTIFCSKCGTQIR